MWICGITFFTHITFKRPLSGMNSRVFFPVSLSVKAQRTWFTWKLFFPIWMIFLWWLNFESAAKYQLQMSHLIGFSPVWTRDVDNETHNHLWPYMTLHWIFFEIKWWLKKRNIPSKHSFDFENNPLQFFPTFPDQIQTAFVKSKRHAHSFLVENKFNEKIKFDIVLL